MVTAVRVYWRGRGWVVVSVVAGGVGGCGGGCGRWWRRWVVATAAASMVGSGWRRRCGGCGSAVAAGSMVGSGAVADGSGGRRIGGWVDGRIGVRRGRIGCGRSDRGPWRADRLRQSDRGPWRMDRGRRLWADRLRQSDRGPWRMDRGRRLWQSDRRSVGSAAAGAAAGSASMGGNGTPSIGSSSEPARARQPSPASVSSSELASAELPSVASLTGAQRAMRLVAGTRERSRDRAYWADGVGALALQADGDLAAVGRCRRAGGVHGHLHDHARGDRAGCCDGRGAGARGARGVS